MPAAPKGGDTGHSSKAAHAGHPHPGLLFPQAAARPLWQWLLQGQICLSLSPRARLPSRSRGAGREQSPQGEPRPLRPLEEEACSPARRRPAPGCARDTAWANRGSRAQDPAVSPATAPRPFASTLPPEVTSSQSTAGGTQARSIHSCLGAQVRRPGRERALAAKLLPTLSEPTALEARPKGQPFQGVRPAHPPPRTSSTRGVPCTLSAQGPRKGPGPPRPGPPWARSRSPPMAPITRVDWVSMSQASPTGRDQRPWRQALRSQLSPRATQVSTPRPFHTRPPSWGGPLALHACPRTSTHSEV